MLASEEILTAFNEILDIRQAYGWNRTEIFGFMHHVVENWHLYDLQADEQQPLRAILQEIKMLCPPDGASFAEPGLEPFQSTKRGINPMWNPRSPTEGSKFCLKTFVHKGIPYSGIFDLLGLFLSSISRAPNRATTRNFYLPILAMYAKWAAELNEPGPKMFNCTWIKEGPGKGTFFLGASLAGYLGGRGSNQTGTWAEVVKGARWALINDPVVQMSGFSMYDSPAFRLTGARKWFGSCAEVYPLVNLLQNGSNPSAIHGIALRDRGVKPEKYEDRQSGEVWRWTRNLCDNCAAIVNMWGGVPENFDRLADITGAPL